ncbi:MAG TPA: spore coat protein YsxE [Chondromyces sp.]|nr:spore coat protein YsxE [Chondromyces sp.]
MAEEWSAVLQNYGLSYKFVEPLGKVAKVYTNKGVFALKKIPASIGIDFIHHIQRLYQAGYHRIVPIYPTMDGRYGVWMNQYLYYLMPWVENKGEAEQGEKQAKLLREIARLHSLSVKEVPVQVEEREDLYKRTKEKWETELELLEQYMILCERETYMSPFQLLFCLYYFEMSQAIKFSRDKLKMWFEAVEEKDRARMVLIHGKISPEHFLYDQQGHGFLTNFERSRWASPIHDLLPFLARSLRTYRKIPDEELNLILYYMQYFPLKEEEVQLLLSYLAYPAALLQTVHRYFSGEQRQNEMRMVRKLQKQYWQLKNIEYVVMQLDQIEEEKRRKKKEEQEGASS